MHKHLKEESRLWDYNINQKLGKGEYGQVFQVTNKTNQLVYALKKMPISGAHQKQKIQAFKQIKCLKLLSHPSIIQYKESFLSMENIYIVMEFAGKGDFLKIVEQRKKKQRYYTEDQLWKIFQIIVKGVKYLHQKNIIHRDLKMENIFMTEDGKVKIGDLGMSKIMSKEDQLISTRVGTPIYFAPQLIRNQLYSYPVDVWSIGCVLYYLTTLEHPFQDASIETLAYYVIQKSPKPIKGNYSPELISFINCFLQKDCKNRPNIFQLALKLKNKNRDSVQTNNKISIFNLRQLTKILNSHHQIQTQRKSSKKRLFNNFRGQKSVNSQRKIYTALNNRLKIPSRNIYSSVQKRDYSGEYFLESPQSPTFVKRYSASSKPEIYRPKRILSAQLSQNSSPLIKSSGFSLHIENKQSNLSPVKRTDHFSQIGFLDLSPQKMVSFKKATSRKSYR